ncbi:MAG: L,D-transpeptidase [Bacteroidales bacterium]|nr:L,D-transpeptidase [Bacteroidales bacterium]
MDDLPRRATAFAGVFWLETMSWSRGRRRVLIFLGVLLILGVAFLGISHIWAPDPPSGEYEAALKAISDARESGAKAFVSKPFAEAMRLADESFREWKSQNTRWPLFRNYTHARELAVKARQMAEEAAVKSKSARHDMKWSLQNSLDSLRRAVDRFDQHYSDLPLEKTVFRNLTNSRINLTEAQKAYKRGDLHLARQKFTESRRFLQTASGKATTQMIHYFSDFHKWKSTYDKAVQWSASHKAAAIVVDKMAHRCFLLKNGKLKKEFVAELGPRWLGNKARKGDKATPEGWYQVTKLKGKGHSRYHKALLINYPNDEDKERFREAKRKGLLPGNAEIGGLIEIHGEGGKGYDWTNGCVALSNEDMDYLYRQVAVGTPVVIVGSLDPPAEYQRFLPE